jgi:hypothetical protein
MMAIVLTLVSSLLSTTWVHARLLNPSASVTLTYTLATTDAENSETEINTFGQRYRVGLSSSLRTIGTLQGDASWFDERFESRTVTQSAVSDQERRLNVLDFHFAADLLPAKFPLALTANRVRRKNEFSGLTTEETIDTLGIHWIGNYARLPRLTASYNLADLDTETVGGSKDFTSQALTINADGSIKNTRITAGYQVSQNKVEDSGTSRSQGLNLGANSQLTTNLQVLGLARYSSSRTPPSVVSGGIGLFQERSVLLSAIYRPYLYWWDGSTSYSYSESPFLSEFKSHVIVGNVNVRPRERLDVQAGTRILRFTTGESEALSESLSTSLNYHPFFGLRTGLGVGVTHAAISNSSDTNTFIQTYNYNISYFRPWRFLRFSTGYRLGYGQSSTSDGPDTSDLSNDLSITVGNTNRRIVGISLSTSFNHVIRETDSQKSDQTSYNVNLDAESSYFRNLILQRDALTLRAHATYTYSSGIGIEGPIQLFSATADYLWKLLSVLAGYNLENYPDEVFLDRQQFIGELNWSFFRIRNLAFQMGLRDSFEDNRFRDDVNRFEQNAQARYRLGKNDITLTYTRIVTDITGTIDSRTISDALYITFFRSFL